LAEKTGYSQEDAELLKEALKTLFENDTSSARPEGSMEVCCLYWWQHNEKTPKVSTAKIHRSIKVEETADRPASFADYHVTYEKPEEIDVEPEVYYFVS
jgi:CRISPR-associated protein Csd2